jgi:hypothetical protein
MADSRSGSRRRWRLVCCSGCALIGVVSLILLWLLLSSPPAPPPPSPAEQQRLEQRIESLRKEVAAIEKDAREGRSRTFQLILTEEEINSFLLSDRESRRALERHRIERAFVRIESGRIYATASRRVNGVLLSVTAVIVPFMRDERSLDARVEQVDVGRLSVPEATVRGLINEIIAAFRAQNLESGARFQSLEIADRKITVTGVTR